MMSYRISLFLLATFSLSACTRQVEVPPLSPTPTQERHTGKFVWFDLLTDDVEEAKAFYGELLGWEFSDNGDDNPIFTTVLKDGEAIAGLVASDQLRREVDQSRWLSYLSVPDADAALRQTEQAGGTRYAGGTDLPQRGRVSVASDPQGALLAFVTSDSGDPVDHDPVEGHFFWNELWASDLDAAESFYTDLVQYQRDLVAANEIEGGVYRVFKRDEQPRAGMLAIPFDGVLPNWVPYIMTPNPSEVARRAEELGGRVLLAPEGAIHGGSALIADPTGGVFGIQRWPVLER